MKRYFRNLAIALFNGDPYKKELEDLSDKYEKTAQRVNMLEKLRADLEDKFVKDVSGLKRLVDVFRQHLQEKDELLERMKKEYQQRIVKYNAKIEELESKIA